MNKNILIVVIIIVIILAGGGVLLLNKSQKSQTNSQNAQTIQPTTQKITVATEKKSLHDLMSLTGNKQCTYTDKDTQGSGTVYTGNGNMRGDFQAQINGKPSQTHVIEDGKYIYFWTNGQAKGYKMPLDFIEKMSDTAMQQYQSQAFDMKKQVNYACSPWAVDGSKFALPSNITFEDFTAMMQGAMRSASNAPSTTMQNNQEACNQCNSLPASAQAQCRTALKCL